MKKILNNYVIYTLTLLLTSCASNPVVQQTANLPQEQQSGTQTISDKNLTPINGPSIGLESMDANDKDKMSHALDKGLGKPTDWVNQRTGINYSVVPVSKLTYQNNPFCRKYNVIMTKNNISRELTGTACISSTDSNWHMVQ